MKRCSHCDCFVSDDRALLTGIAAPYDEPDVQDWIDDRAHLPRWRRWLCPTCARAPDMAPLKYVVPQPGGANRVRLEQEGEYVCQDEPSPAATYAFTVVSGVCVVTTSNCEEYPEGKHDARTITADDGCVLVTDVRVAANSADGNPVVFDVCLFTNAGATQAYDESLGASLVRRYVLYTDASAGADAADEVDGEPDTECCGGHK